MFDIPWTDISAYFGQAALGFATLNLLLGMIISLRYSPTRLWPHRRMNLFALHSWTAYLAIAFALAHPLALLLIRKPAFRFIDILWPMHSPLQPWVNLAGAAALYLLVLVLVSSLLRTRIGRPLWRNLHWLVYPAAILLLIHGILTDPDLKDGHPDLLDGGKVFVEAAALLFLLAVAIRSRKRTKGFRPE